MWEILLQGHILSTGGAALITRVVGLLLPVFVRDTCLYMRPTMLSVGQSNVVYVYSLYKCKRKCKTV